MYLYTHTVLRTTLLQFKTLYKLQLLVSVFYGPKYFLNICTMCAVILEGDEMLSYIIHHGIFESCEHIL